MGLWKRKTKIVDESMGPSTPEEAAKVMKGLGEMYPEMMSDPNWGKSKKPAKKKKVIADDKDEAPKSRSEQTAGDLRNAGMTDEDLKRLGYGGR